MAIRKNIFRSLVALCSLAAAMNASYADWTQTNGPAGGAIYSFAVSGTRIFAGGDGGVFLSTNRGKNWTAVNAGLPDTKILALAVGGAYLFAGVEEWPYGGVYRSGDNGASWTAVNKGLENTAITALAVVDSNLYAGASRGRVFRSSDNGANWVSVHITATTASVLTFGVNNGKLFAGTQGSGMFLSLDAGEHWGAVDTVLKGLTIYTIVVSDGNMFAATSGGVFVCADTGASWTASNTGLPFSGRFHPVITPVRALAVSAATLVEANVYGGVSVSTTYGANWNPVTAGVPVSDIHAFAVAGPDLFAGSDDGIYVSTTNGTSWAPANEGVANTSVTAFVQSGKNLCAGSARSVFVSTDNGMNWVPGSPGTDWGKVNGTTYPSVNTFAIGGSNLYAGTNSGVYRSRDNGASWSLSASLMNRINSLAVSGSTLIAGTEYSGVYVSTDTGTTWTKSAAITYSDIPAVAIIGTDLFVAAGSSAACNYRSSDSGVTWKTINNGIGTFYGVRSFSVSGSSLYAVTMGGQIFRSADRGDEWKRIGPVDSYIRTVAFSGVNVFAGSDDGVFLLTSFDGAWMRMNEGLFGTRINSLAISGGFLVAGTYGRGVWRRPLSEMIAGYDDGSVHIPDRYMLYQNYPNPFNPSTTISFTLPQASFASLTIFDAMGREVATLASEELPAGSWSRHWNAAAMPSGVYYYRLTAGLFTAVRHLMLVK